MNEFLKTVVSHGTILWEKKEGGFYNIRKPYRSPRAFLEIAMKTKIYCNKIYDSALILNFDISHND
jgi:hypothetical protein